MHSRASSERASHFLARRLEHQLVVHLEDQLRSAASRSRSAGVDPDHGPLDEIRLAALDHGIDGHSLGRLAEHPVAGPQIRKYRRRPKRVVTKPVSRAVRHRFVEESTNATVAIEIGVDGLLGLCGGDSQLPLASRMPRTRR